MAKKYYVWKDPACGGVNIQWIELDGKEFQTMMKRPENKGRRFIRFGNEVDLDENLIYLEATEAQYLDWRREKDARLYRKKVNSTFKTLSLDGQTGKGECVPLRESIADTEKNTEESAIKNLEVEKIREVLNHFTNEELWLIEAIYVKKRTATDVAAELGVSQPAVSKRAKRLLERIKKYFENCGL